MNNQCCPPNVFNISTGDDGTMNLRAAYAQTLAPLDLTSCSAIDVLLPKADGTFLDLSIGSGAVGITSPAVLGAFTASISAAQSALLMVGELQSFAVVFTIASKKQTIWFLNCLTITQQ